MSLTPEERERILGEPSVLVAHGWNVEQILVYIWQICSGESSAQEYPYMQFANSEAGKRLRVELALLADGPQLTAEDVTEIIGPVLCPGRVADLLNGRRAGRRRELP